MDAWVKSVFLAQALLGDILVCRDRFTDYKDHTGYKVDDQIVEATVATLSLDEERGQLSFAFRSELQKETQEQDGEYQPLAYYVSACLFACRAFTEAELKRLGGAAADERCSRFVRSPQPNRCFQAPTYCEVFMWRRHSGGPFHLN